MKKLSMEKVVARLISKGYDASMSVDGDYVLVKVPDAKADIHARIQRKTAEERWNTTYSDLTEDEMCDKVVETYLTQIVNDKRITDISEEWINSVKDWDAIKDSLYMYLRNDKSVDDGTGSAYVSKAFTDKINIFYYISPSAGTDVENEGLFTVRVTENMLSQWNKTVDDVHSTAFMNTKNNFGAKTTNFYQMLCNLGAGKEEIQGMLDEDDSPFSGGYILTNNTGLYGATAILYSHDTLKNISNESDDPGQNLIIIPSSVHEVIVIPESNIRGTIGDHDEVQERLAQMISEVNMGLLEKKDILSDIPYVYNVATDGIEVY